MSLALCPIGLRAANAWVDEVHRPVRRLIRTEDAARRLVDRTP